MPVKLISLKCPNCGGELEMPTESETFYCKYCGSLLYADDDSKKLQIDAKVSGSITANINFRDEAEIRKLEIAEQQRQQSEIEAYRERWKKQVKTVPLIVAILSIFAGAAIGDKSKPIAYQWGQGIAASMYLVLPAAVILFFRRPNKFEQTHNAGFGTLLKPNNDALLRMLDENGLEDYSRYLKNWKRQLAAYPIALILPAFLARVLARVESWYCRLASIERFEPLVSIRRVLLAVFLIVLFAGPILLFIRRPSKYIQSYVRTIKSKDMRNSREG